jgi:hypothetical protein
VGARGAQVARRSSQRRTAEHRSAASRPARARLHGLVGSLGERGGGLGRPQRSGSGQVSPAHARSGPLRWSPAAARGLGGWRRWDRGEGARREEGGLGFHVVIQWLLLIARISNIGRWFEKTSGRYIGFPAEGCLGWSWAFCWADLEETRGPPNNGVEQSQSARVQRSPWQLLPRIFYIFLIIL